ncbi:hypothetical protein [Pseudoalteromonas sp. 1_2015MBL_MicDiv]|uniref:hypothetical protein n=1 Tax=Pseudoalteromonas sp. 1_2015MBL_MicDiv TaxID=1720343 RepID=UPI000BBE4A84|nr:hypothetical protein [Pseudoalteromonas sp. 1_2015MBL_MicDiv]ATG77686.1 hypothetical protein AOR04_09155 [Pseudoalteromonas sp. 1_2015MBL_MicDiv]
MTSLTSIQHGAELTRNYATLKSIKAGNDLVAALDHKKLPIVFAIGEDNIFGAIVQPESHLERENRNAPWESCELFKGEVRHFAQYQKNDDAQIRLLLVAVDRDEQGNETGERMFYSELLDNDLRGAFNKGAITWTEQRLPENLGRINRLRCGEYHAAFSTEGEQAYYYTLRLGDSPVQNVIPANSEKIHDFQVGHYLGDAGFFLLYQSAEDAQTLLFSPSGSLTGENNSRFSVSKDTRSIVLLPGNEDSNYVVSAGREVTLHYDEYYRDTLIEGRGDSIFTQLTTSRSDEGISLFALEYDALDHSRLVYLTNQYYESEQGTYKTQWTPDIPLMKGVRQFSCVKSSQLENHLVVVDEREQLIHFFLDPTSGLWNEQYIRVAEPQKIVEQSSYITRMSVYDDNGNLLPNHECFLTSDRTIQAEINGVSHILGPEQPKAAMTDMTGAVTVIFPCESLDTPLIKVGLSADKISHVFDPAHAAMETLSQVNGVSDFKDARTGDDLPLWDNEEQPSDSNLNQASLIFKQMVSNRKELIADQRQGITGIMKSTEEGIQDQNWGAKFVGDDIKYLNSNEADDELHHDGGFHPFKWAGHVIGSIFMAVKNAFITVRSFVAKVKRKILTFVIKIGASLVKFVIKTVEEIFPFMTYVFDAIKLVFDKVVGWLGSLLGVDDIWYTHKRIASSTRNGVQQQIQYFEAQAEKWEAYVDKELNVLEDKLLVMRGDDAPDLEEPRNSLLSSVMRLFNNPIVNFGLYNLLHTGGASALRNVEADGFPALETYLDDKESLAKKLVVLLNDQTQAALDGLLHPTRFLKELMRIIADLGIAIMETVKSMFAGMARMLVEGLKHIQNLLDKKVEVPFFTIFYQFIGGLYESDKVDAPKLLDVLAFITAVPVSISYRIFTFKKFYKKLPEWFGSKDMYEEVFAPANPDDLLLPSKTTEPLSGAMAECNLVRAGGGNLLHSYAEWGGLIAANNSIFMLILGKTELADEPKWNAASKIVGIMGASVSFPVMSDDSAGSHSVREAAYIQRLISYITSSIDLLACQPWHDDDYQRDGWRKLGYRNRLSAAVSVIVMGLTIAADATEKTDWNVWVADTTSTAGDTLSAMGDVLKIENPYYVGTTLGIQFVGAGFAFGSAIAATQAS